jgi:mannose-6-phosphate isomerase-like protein (cupin superfamily)
MVYYVLTGRGNLAYAPGGPGEITNVMYDWDTDSYSYIAPRQRHSMSNQGEGPLSVLRVQYDAKRSLDSVIPWGVPIFKVSNPIRIDHMPSLLSIVNQTPQAFRSMGAEHFRAIEYEVVHESPKRDVPAQATSDTQGETPRDEIVNYVLRGRGSYLVESREHPVKAGCSVYANPSQIIDLTPTRLVDVEQLTLDYLYFSIRI